MYPNEENPINQLIDALDVEAVESQFSESQEEELSFSETIKAMVASVNATVPDARKVMPIEAMTVAHRSLSRTIMSPDAQARAFTALREVSDYISMATTGNPAKMSSQNTDLLSIGHPLSTSTEYASLIERIEKRSEWFAADPRISEEYRTVVASAYLTVPDTVERQYSIARLESADAQDVPREVVLAIIAAGNPFSGENSFLARSARAKLQRRDRRGRFAWMGGGARFFTKGLKGFIDSIVGKFVGSDPKTNTFDVEVFDHPTLGTGIFRIPATNVEGVKAYIGGKLGKMLALKGKRSADYAKDYALDQNSLQRIDAPSGWSAAGNGFASADGYYAIKHAAGAELPDLQRHIDTYGAEVKGLGENGAIDPKYPVYEVMTNPLSQPQGRFADGGNQSIGYYQSWGDVQAGVSRYDRKNDQKRSGAVQKRMWGDVPQGEFPKNTFEQVTPADPEKGLPYSTYRSANNAKNLGGFTVRRYQPEQHKAVQSRMEENVKNGAVVNGFRSGSSEIEDDQPIFEITRQVAPWEDKNIQPEVIGYAQDWEDVQAIAENNETTSPRQPNPRDKKVRAFKAKTALDHVHDDDVISPEDFTKQEDGSYATKPSSDEALRATVRENAQGKWVAEVYNDKASQESFDPASRRTYNNPEDAIENAAEWMTEENDSRSDRPKTEAQLREERNGQMLYSGDPKATLPEDLGEPNSPEAKEALAKVGIDLQTPEKPADNKSATDLADELDSLVPQFLVSPEVVGKNHRTLAVGKTMMANIKRWAGLERGNYQFQEIKRPDDSVLDEIDDFVEKSKELTAATRARIIKRMKEKYGDQIFEKLAEVASGNAEQERLKKLCEAEARKTAEKRWQKENLEQQAIESALEQSYIKTLYDPVTKNREIQKYVEGVKERFIEKEVKFLTTKGAGSAPPQWEAAVSDGDTRISSIYDRRKELMAVSRFYEKAAKDLGIISREEYQQLFKDLDIPMYDGDGSDFIDFSGIRRTSVPDKKMSDSVDAAKESVEWALRSYPAAIVERIKDYVQKNSDNGKLKVIWSENGRGYFAAGENTLALSYELRDPDYDIPIGGSVGVHEFGHAFEQAFPELKSMEWGFLFSQGLPKNEDGSRPNQMDSSVDRNALPIEVVTDSPNYREVEIAVPDMFRNTYSGRVYYQGRADLQLNMNPNSAYEIFTTGTESVLSAKHDVRFINNPKVIDAYDNRELSAEDLLLDSNNSAFTLGVLVSVARSDKKSDSSLKPEDSTILLSGKNEQEPELRQIGYKPEITPSNISFADPKLQSDYLNRAAEIANGIKNPKAAEAAKRRVDAMRKAIKNGSDLKVGSLIQSAPATLVAEDLGVASKRIASRKAMEVVSRLTNKQQREEVTEYPTTTHTEKFTNFDYTTQDGEKFTISFSETNVHEKNPEFELGDYTLNPIVRVYDSEGDAVGSLAITRWDAGTDIRRGGIARLSPTDEFDINQPFSTIGTIYVEGRHQRKGVATAMLEVARDAMDVPVYHSPLLSADGRAFADKVQSSAELVDEDLGSVNANVNDSEKAKEVKSRLTKADTPPRPMVSDGVEYIEQDYDYKDPKGNDYVITHRRPALRQAEAIAQNKYQVVDHFVYITDPKTGKMVGDMNYYMYPANYEFADSTVAETDLDKLDSSKPFYTIAGIAVNHEYKRRGLATAMLEAARSDTDFPIFHSAQLSTEGFQFAHAVQSPAQVLDEDLGDVRERAARRLPTGRVVTTGTQATRPTSEARRLAQEKINSRIKSNGDLETKFRDLDLSNKWVSKNFPKEKIVTETGEYTLQNGMKIGLSRHDRWSIDTEGREYLTGGSIEAHLIEDSEMDAYPIGSFYYSEARSYPVEGGRELNWDVTEVGGSSENVKIDKNKPFSTVDWVEVDENLQREGIATAMMEFARSNSGMPIYHDQTRTTQGTRFSDAVQSSPSEVLEQEDLGSPATKQEDVRSRIKYDNNLEEIRQGEAYKTVTETADYTTPDGRKVQLFREDFWITDEDSGDELSGGEVTVYAYDKDGNLDETAPIGQISYSEVGYEPFGNKSRIYDTSEIGGTYPDDLNPFKPFATIDMIEVSEKYQRQGIATAVLDFARKNAGMPIYHSHILTPDGKAFSNKVQSSNQVMEEDLGTQPQELKLIFQGDNSTPQEQIRKRIESDDNLETKVWRDGNRKNVTETATYTTAEGQKFQLKRDDYWSISGRGEELDRGVVEAFPYDENGEPDISAAAYLHYKEATYETLPNGQKRWDSEEIGGSSLDDPNFDEYKPFSTIDMIEVVEEDSRRKGLATAMLEFARTNSGMPIYHSWNLTPEGKGFAGKVQSAETPTEEDLGTPSITRKERLGRYLPFIGRDPFTGKKKIKIPPLAKEPKIETGRDPKALEAAKKVRKLAEQMEPEVTKIMVGLAEALDGDLDQLDQRLKSTDSLARKIKDDADKEHKGDIDTSSSKVSDSIRYTMTVDGSKYTDSVLKVIARFEAMGYEVRVKNFWEGGDPYQGINMKLTKNGVTVEFQMHTPESLQIKVDQLHDIYDVYREIDTNEGQDLEKLERKERLWEQMIGIASQIPNPDNYDELLSIGTLVQQQFEL